MNPEIEDRLISTAELRRLLGDVSVMFVNRRQHDDPDFPRPIQFTPRGPRKWWLSELQHYLERCRARREAADG